MRTIEVTLNGRSVTMRVRPFYKHERLIVAIDPDTSLSGVVSVQNGQILKMESLDFFSLQDLMPKLVDGKVLVLLEDVDNNKPTYGRGTNEAVKHAISRKVGRVQHAARQIRQLLERAGVEYLLIKPLMIPEKQHSKRDAQFFSTLTDWEGRTNEDKRDAAMIGLYGLPDKYQVCEKRRVYVGQSCSCCKRVSPEANREKIHVQA
jgi:hypothetical protein